MRTLFACHSQNAGKEEVERSKVYDNNTQFYCCCFSYFVVVVVDFAFITLFFTCMQRKATSVLCQEYGREHWMSVEWIKRKKIEEIDCECRIYFFPFNFLVVLMLQAHTHTLTRLQKILMLLMLFVIPLLYITHHPQLKFTLNLYVTHTNSFNHQYIACTPERHWMWMMENECENEECCEELKRKRVKNVINNTT
jgi:hypothetical protein